MTHHTQYLSQHFIHPTNTQHTCGTQPSYTCINQRINTVPASLWPVIIPPINHLPNMSAASSSIDPPVNGRVYFNAPALLFAFIGPVIVFLRGPSDNRFPLRSPVWQLKLVSIVYLPSFVMLLNSHTAYYSVPLY